MALADNILAQERSAYHRVTIGHVPFIPFQTDDTGVLAITDIKYQESLDQPCPTVTLGTNRVGEIRRGFLVEVDLGFGGLNRRVFTGTVQQRGQPGVADGQIDCAGDLWRLVRATFDEPRDVGGLTVAQGIASIFDEIGIANYDLTAVPAYTLKSDATIPAGTGMAQLQQLMDVDGLRVRETGSGQVIVARYEGAPSASYFRQYTTDGDNVRILDGGVTENPNWYRTKVTVLGARLADGSDVSISVELSDTTGARPSLPVGTHIPEVFSIPLIWDTTQATEAATRLAAEHGRVPQTFRMTVPLDPQLEIGMTLGVSAPEWNVSGNWLIWGVQHDVAADRTTVQLVGGPEFAGTINVNPIAAFTFKAENQPLGAQRYTFVTLDATGSYQPDNLEENLSYDWSGDQDAADSPAIDSQTSVGPFTISIDPTAMVGDVLTVTLVVTNEAGLTATVIHEINITPESSDTTVVSLAAALKTRFAFSADGGETWNFQTGTDITTCAAAPSDGVHTNYAVYGRDNGQIYRTTDGCATAPTSVKSSNSIAIVDIKWDWRDPTKVWALDANCQLFVSTDYGATWVEIVDWRTSMSLSTIIGKKLILHPDGGVYVFGGTGVTSNGRPFIGRFRGGLPFGFASVFGGDLATDLGSGSTNLAVADAVYQASGGLLIVLENYTAYNSGVRPAYWVPDPMVPTGWKRIGSAEGLDSGVTTAGKVATPAIAGTDRYHMMFTDRDAWHVDCTSGTPVATVTADFLDANFTPNEAILCSDEQEGVGGSAVHILAVEDAGGSGALIKSYDDMLTQADILPGMTAWPVAGAQGKDVAIGPAGQLSTNAKIVIGGLLGSPTERFIAWREGQGNFEAYIFASILDSCDFVNLRAISSDVWFGFWTPSAGLGGSDDFITVRTKDGGSTWDEPYATPTDGGLTRVWCDIVRGADGRLWGLTQETGTDYHMEIWYNDDPEGDGSWTESKDSAIVDDNDIVRLAAHPRNKNRIVAWGFSDGLTKVRTWVTTDEGANWNVNESPAFLSVAATLEHGMVMCESNRLVMVGFASNAANIFTSDDNGLTWTSRKTFSNITTGAGENIQGPILGNPSGTRLFVMVTEEGATPDDIQIWESVDGGTIWTLAAGDDLGNGPPQPAATDHYRGGLAFDSTEGALYLYGAGEGNTNNINHVVKTVGLGWQDVSDNLIGALTGHTSYSLSNNGSYSIAVIPS